MKERTIFFSAPMVRAILDGSKTQARRIIKPQPFGEFNSGNYHPTATDKFGFDEPGKETFGVFCIDGSWSVRCPYGRPGSRLWVREALAHDAESEEHCRITLEITTVRVERLHDISQEDARAEGAPPSHPSIDKVSHEFGYADFPRSWYGQLWESINGAGSWAANPWVWVIELRRIA